MNSSFIDSVVRSSACAHARPDIVNARPIASRFVEPLRALFILVLCASAGHAAGACTGALEEAGRLTSHEPSMIGATWDEDDVRFMDFTVSVKTPIWPSMFSGPRAKWYFAFTGRFGQYIKTRESSPVIGKRFNPETFLRLADCRIDVGYGHESNGQGVDSEIAFEETARMQKDRRFAKDYVSRGWDYLKLSLCGDSCEPVNRNPVLWQLNARYFLERGLLQDRPEEYNDWERDPEGRKRKSVDGVTLVLARRFDSFLRVADVIATASYTTGYAPAFRYHTYRLSFGTPIAHVPVMLWAAYGYNSDLAQYYRKVRSVGITAELGRF